MPPKFTNSTKCKSTSDSGKAPKKTKHGSEEHSLEMTSQQVGEDIELTTHTLTAVTSSTKVDDVENDAYEMHKCVTADLTVMLMINLWKERMSKKWHTLIYTFFGSVPKIEYIIFPSLLFSTIFYLFYLHYSLFRKHCLMHFFFFFLEMRVVS